MKNNQTEKDLGLIKDLMEKSTKFSNLSGIAVFFTGVLAMIGASFVYFNIGFSISEINISYAQLINLIDSNSKTLNGNLIINTS